MMTKEQTVPLSYAIRLALAFEGLNFTKEYLRLSQNEAIAEVSREFNVQPEDVEAALTIKASAK